MAEKPTSKLRELGIEKYLDGTTGLHNGLGYSDLTERVKLLDTPDMTKARIARDFGIERQTLYTWLEMLPEAQVADDITAKRREKRKWPK